MPDMRMIQEAVARPTYCSKIDMTNAYKQICIEIADVLQTTFSTPQGAYISNTMQQGNCNAPCTFQRALTWELRKEIGHKVHVWFDDIFTSTDTVSKHNRALLWLFNCLHQAKFYISQKKFQAFMPIMDVLGCQVDKHGIHAQLDKMEKIRHWREPTDHTGVL